MPTAKIKAVHVIYKVKGRFRGKLEIDDNGQIIMQLNNNEKDKIKPLDEWVNNPDKSNDYTIQMTITRADKANVTKAFLKTAYLNCFYQWGYQFVLSDTGKRMREVIFRDALYPVDNVPFLVFHELEYVSRLPFGVCFV